MAITPVVLANRLGEARTFGDIGGKLVYITLLFPKSSIYSRGRRSEV